MLDGLSFLSRRTIIGKYSKTGQLQRSNLSTHSSHTEFTVTVLKSTSPWTKSAAPSAIDHQKENTETTTPRKRAWKGRRKNARDPKKLTARCLKKFQTIAATMQRTIEATVNDMNRKGRATTMKGQKLSTASATRAMTQRTGTTKMKKPVERTAKKATKDCRVVCILFFMGSGIVVRGQECEERVVWTRLEDAQASLRVVVHSVFDSIAYELV
jgi:hypothetical protein